MKNKYSIEYDVWSRIKYMSVAGRRQLLGWYKSGLNKCIKHYKSEIERMEKELKWYKDNKAKVDILLNGENNE